MHTGPGMPWAPEVSATGEKLERVRRRTLQPLGISLLSNWARFAHILLSDGKVKATRCPQPKAACTPIGSMLLTGVICCWMNDKRWWLSDKKKKHTENCWLEIYFWRTINNDVRHIRLHPSTHVWPEALRKACWSHQIITRTHVPLPWAWPRSPQMQVSCSAGFSSAAYHSSWPATLDTWTLAESSAPPWQTDSTEKVELVNSHVQSFTN